MVPAVQSIFAAKEYRTRTAPSSPRPHEAAVRMTFAPVTSRILSAKPLGLERDPAKPSPLGAAESTGDVEEMEAILTAP